MTGQCIIRGLLAAVLFATPLVAAAQKESLPNPILAPGTPWAFDGFIVDAPGDEGWASLSKDAKSAELGKKFDDGRFAAAVIDGRKFPAPVLREEDLLAIVKQAHGTAPDASMKVLDYQAQALTPKGILCARMSARFEDTREQYESSGMLHVHGLSCVRPDRPEIIVSLQFAERTQQEQAPALTDMAEGFLQSLRFAPTSKELISQAQSAVGSKNSEEAIRLLTPAAEQGDGEASLFLGNMYLYGAGVEEDLQAARKWLEVAAREGRIDALYNLGAIYDKGLGVPRDVKQAIKWFILAADQRDPQAQVNLAILYFKGDGVDKDVRSAEEWLKRAAGNGSKRAQGILAHGGLKKE